MTKTKQISLVLILFSFTHVQAAFFSVEVKGFVCALCGQGVEKRLQKISDNKIENYAVDMDTQTITFEVKDDVKLNDQDIKQAITKAGYAVVSLEKAEKKTSGEKKKVEKPKQKEKKQTEHDHQHGDMKDHQHKAKKK